MDSEIKNRTSRYAERTGQFSIAALLALLPFHGITTLNEILFFLSLSAFIIIVLSNIAPLPGRFAPSKTLNILIALSFVWGIITLVNAIDPNYSLHEITHKMSKHYILYFLAFQLVRLSQPVHTKMKWLLLPFIISAVLMSIYACYQFSLFPAMMENRVTGLTGRFYRFTVLLVLSFPLVVVSGILWRGWAKWVLLLSIPVILTALFFTFTRAGWIAVMVEGFILAALFLKKYRKILFIGVILATLLISVLAYRSADYKILLVHGSEKPRMEAFFYSMEIIRDNPVMGIGYGKKTFSRRYPQIYVKHAHNIFLNTAVELGITGCIIFMAMLFIIFKNFISSLRRESAFEQKVLLAGILTSITGFLVLNLFDYMYHGWPGQIFWILTGMGFTLTYSGRADANRAIHDKKSENGIQM